jgi:hypothetical protein
MPSGYLSQVGDLTIISTDHQLYYDCPLSSKSFILAHLDGLHQIIRIRGSLYAIGVHRDLAHIVKV